MILEFIKYDPNDGSFTWIKSPNRSIKIGSLAGHRDKSGYLKIRFKGKNLRAHRIAFLQMTGEYPKGVVDHIDRDKLNNKWSNLRDTTISVNNRNRSNIRGFYQPVNGRYQVVISINGKRKHLGVFESEELAKLVYEEAKNKLDGGFQVVSQ